MVEMCPSGRWPKKTRYRKDGKPWGAKKLARPKRSTERPDRDPETEARWRKIWPERAPRSRMGVPDGMRKKDALPLWERAHELGKKFITVMEDLDKVEKVPVPGSEQEMAKQALEKAFVMAVSPLTSSKERAAFLRLVLEFTKAKPESKSKITLDKSEEWLAELAADMPKDGQTSDPSQAA